ncbi:MAG: hypothetical protein IJ197_06530 [Bacteroidaceae bacterium]|nr:hypothetical protein [Bacteroidaceae bacterium]
MKKVFYLVGLLLVLVVSGMVFVSCSDDEEGETTDVFSQIKGYWKCDQTEWMPYMEITDKNLYYRLEDGSVGEKYIINKFDTKTNTLTCTYIDLDDGSYGYIFYLKVITVNKEKLYVNCWEEGYEEYDPVTYTRMN